MGFAGAQPILHSPDKVKRMPTTNVDKQSLRGFLRMVEQDFPDEIVRIRAPVGLGPETTALVFELERAGKQPVVVFENVAGGKMPLVTNVAANRRLLAACLGVAPEDLPSAFRERDQRLIFLSGGRGGGGRGAGSCCRREQ